MQYKEIVITGGSNGIGAALVNALHKPGNQVYVLDLVLPQHTVEGVHYIQVDITNNEAMRKAWDSIGHKVDLLFVNAGVMRRGDIYHTSEEAYDVLMTVNVKGSWLTVKHAHLSNNATVVFTSSRHAIIPPANPAIYGLTKAACAQLANILQVTRPELDVRTVYPGSIHTRIATMELPEEEHDAKIRTTIEPEELVEKIIAFLKTPHKELWYDQVTHTYKSR